MAPWLSSDEIAHLLAVVATASDETMRRIGSYMAPQTRAYRAEVIERLATMISSIASTDQPPG